MSGRAETIRSPSTLRTRRRTPWVEGCWGPKLSSISRSPSIGGPASETLRDGAGAFVAHETTFRFVSSGAGPPPSGYRSG